jgi:PAS domain S-box-containing protein
MNLPFRKDRGPAGLLAGLVSYYPVRHPATFEIFAVAVSFQDITEQLRTQHLLTENQERLRFAQEVGKIGAFEWDLQTNRIFWTSEMEGIYGLGPGEFGGFYEGWLKWIHPIDLGRMREKVGQVLAGEGELNAEFRIVTRRGDERWILARGKTLQDPEGGRGKLIGINIDLTDQKLIEEKLRRTETNLLQALAVRDEFLAIASHELKTPLTSLKLQLQMFQRTLLRGGTGELGAEEIQHFLERNGRQLDRLTRLVDDMLDISRIRTGKLTLKKERCELRHILKDIIARHREQFLASGSGDPVVEELAEVEGLWDPLRIEQVLTNIITNAVRYGQGKPIHIAVKRYRNSVRISVKDHGPGIPKSDQSKIFERYERGILSREVSGLGLGLFITKQIVEAHEGRIWVESEFLHGATFFVDLPALPGPGLPADGGVNDYAHVSSPETP